MATFNISAARKAGYSDQEINDFMRQNNLMPLVDTPPVAPVQTVAPPTPQVQAASTTTPIDPEQQVRGGLFDNIKSVVGKAARFLAPATMNIAQDAGQSAYVEGDAFKQANQSKEDYQNVIRGVIKKAENATEPEMRKKLFDIAKNALNQSQSIGNDYQPEFSKDVNLSPAERGIASGTEIGTIVAVPQAKGTTATARIGSMAAQGGTSSALRELTSTEQMTPEERLKNTAIAGGIGAAIGAGTQAVGEAYNAVRGAGDKVKEVGDNYRKEVRQIKQPASVYGSGKEKAISQTLDDLGFKGTPANQYSQLEPKMAELESQIQSLVKSNPDIKVNVGDIRQSFMDNLESSLRSKDLTSSQAKKEIEGYIADLIKSSGGTPSDELSLGSLRDLKKLVNKDYGPVYNIAERGGALTPRQKVIQAAWDSLDSAVKNASPEMKKLLEMESNLYKAAPSLSSARFNAPTFRAFGTSVPGKVSQGLQDATGKTITGVGNAMDSLPELPNISPVISEGSQATISNTVGQLPAAAAENNDNQGQNNSSQDYGTDNSQHQPIIPQESYLTGHSPETLYQAYMLAKENGDTKAANELHTMYQDEVTYQKEQSQGTKTKPKSAAGLQVEGKAKAGLSALDTIEQQIKQNPYILLQASIPGSPGARLFEASVSSLTDAIGGLRTGATVSKEQQAYYRNMLPKVGDSPETIMRKLDAVHQELSGYLTGSDNVYDPAAPLPAISP